MVCPLALSEPALLIVAARGDGAIAVVILASIVVPLAALGWLCWFFWKHRHDQ